MVAGVARGSSYSSWEESNRKTCRSAVCGPSRSCGARPAWDVLDLQSFDRPSCRLGGAIRLGRVPNAAIR